MATNQQKHIFNRVTLPAGSTITPVINLYGSTLLGFKFPVGFDGATITLLAGIADDGSAFAPVADSVAGTVISITAGADKYILTGTLNLTGLQYIKIVSATIAAANREIIVISRPVA